MEPTYIIFRINSNMFTTHKNDTDFPCLSLYNDFSDSYTKCTFRSKSAGNDFAWVVEKDSFSSAVLDLIFLNSL